MDFLSHVNACVLNQCSGHRFFFYALQFAMSMHLKFREELTNP